MVCLGFLLSLPVSRNEGSSALGMANVLLVGQGTNGPPLDGTYYPFALAEEVTKTEKDPVNARLLTMLFLATSFFGMITGWLLTNAQGQGALCSSLGVVGGSPSRARGDYLPFLGVFRL
jgi:hypothetical protein